MRVPRYEIREAILPEHFAVLILRFRDAVCKHDEQIARPHFEPVLTILGKRECTHNHAVHFEPIAVPVAHQDRRQVPGVAVRQRGGRALENSAEERGELLRRREFIEMLIDMSRQLGRNDRSVNCGASGHACAQFERPAQFHAEGRLQRRHEQRGRDSLARDIGDRDSYVAVRELLEIVVIAGDLPRRNAGSGDQHRIRLGHRSRIELVLHLAREVEIHLDALPLLLHLEQPLYVRGHLVE